MSASSAARRGFAIPEPDRKPRRSATLTLCTVVCTTRRRRRRSSVVGGTARPCCGIAAPEPRLRPSRATLRWYVCQGAACFLVCMAGRIRQMAVERVVHAGHSQPEPTPLCPTPQPRCVILSRGPLSLLRHSKTAALFCFACLSGEHESMLRTLCGLRGTGGGGVKPKLSRRASFTLRYGIRGGHPAKPVPGLALCGTYRVEHREKPSRGLRTVPFLGLSPI